jgi:hypothetical protein
MASYSQFTAVWTGFTGSPGYSHLNFSEVTDPAVGTTVGNAIRSFFFALGNYLQTGWTIQVQSAWQNLDLATGKPELDFAMTTAVLPVVGNLPATTKYAGGAGAVVDWLTGSRHNGHKIQGRTFLVPLCDAFQGDGSLADALVTSLSAAGNTLAHIPAAQLGVISRKPGYASLAPVSGCKVPDRAAQLRSRRA